MIKEFLAHYHHERKPQGEDIDNALLFPDDRIEEADPDGNIVIDERLGGLLKFYRRSNVTNGQVGTRSGNALGDDG